jgi:hypothetical protein
MVNGRKQMHDAVTQPDPLGPLRSSSQEHVGSAGVRVLFEKMVFDHPCGVEPEAVGQLDLLKRLRQDSAVVINGPGPRHLMLEEQAELHNENITSLVP